MPHKAKRQRAVFTLTDTAEGGFSAELMFEPSIKDRTVSSPCVNAAFRLAAQIKNTGPAMGAEVSKEELEAGITEDAHYIALANLVGYARRHGIGGKLASHVANEFGQGLVPSIRPDEWTADQLTAFLARFHGQHLAAFSAVKPVTNPTHA